ncbi:portal protein [Mycobacteroides phage 8UZL]|nr:portal protein [Mycobacteroides phage 8UZL]
MTIALLAGLSDDDRALLAALERKVESYRQINRLLRAYYEGNIWLNKLGFSVPPKMKDFQNVIGWPAIVVDVIEERLKWRGWIDFDDPAPSSNQVSSVQKFLDLCYVENNLDAEAPLVHLDALMFGCGFVSVGTRDPELEDEESTPLITAESTELTTGIYDTQRRRMTSGVSFRTDDEGNIVRATLYKLGETIFLRRTGVHGWWQVVDRDQHDLKRLPLIPFINRPTGSRRQGRSEITRPIRGYTDIGIRTLLGMETNREFFSAPQRYALGVTEEDFVDAAGNKIPGWAAVLGRVWGVGRDDNGDLPQLGQFDPAPSRPYLEQIQGLAQLIAADGAVPQTYLGFMSDNPASADSIRALESRLIKRSERRISSFGWSWAEVGRVTWMIQENRNTAPHLDTDWGNPATPTQQADADAAMKLVSVDILAKDSVITRNRLGFTKTEQKILEREDRQRAAKERLEARRNANQGIQQPAGGAGGGTPPNAPSASAGAGAGPNRGVPAGSNGARR